jgi:hypothetical protein
VIAEALAYFPENNSTEFPFSIGNEAAARTYGGEKMYFCI